MEIKEREFHRVLRDYFKDLGKSMNRIGMTADNVERIAKELDALVELEKKMSGRENVTVHIGKLFGFKIKEN